MTIDSESSFEYVQNKEEWEDEFEFYKEVAIKAKAKKCSINKKYTGIKCKIKP